MKIEKKFFWEPSKVYESNTTRVFVPSSVKYPHVDSTYMQASNWLYERLDYNLWNHAPAWVIDIDHAKGHFFLFEKEVDPNLIMLFKLTFA